MSPICSVAFKVIRYLLLEGSLPRACNSRVPLFAWPSGNLPSLDWMEIRGPRNRIAKKSSIFCWGTPPWQTLNGPSRAKGQGRAVACAPIWRWGRTGPLQSGGSQLTLQWAGGAPAAHLVQVQEGESRLLNSFQMLPAVRVPVQGQGHPCELPT